MPRLRLAFMGSPDFAIPTLRALIDAGHVIAAVYSQPPRPAGRGKNVRRCPVHSYAEAAGLTVRTPPSLKDAQSQESFRALALDAAVVAAYGLILPAPILAAPRLGCLNVHASLLPRWRGAAPIQRAIMAGDAETGITIMLMDAGLDTGPVLLQRSLALDGTETNASLHDSLAEIGGPLMVQVLDELNAGRLQPHPQDAAQTTYAAKITAREAVLDWRQPATTLERQVRALCPHPGAWFMARGQRIKVLAAHVVETTGAPGTRAAGGPVIACGDGGLYLDHVQRAGRKPATGDAFLRGFDLPPGTVLSLPE